MFGWIYYYFIKLCFIGYRYRYGNYDRYYGSRLGKTVDPRMALLRKEWIEKKSVLDIGCNVGFLTLSIAKDFEPRRIIGIDIDEHLIGVARKNIRHYCKENVKVPPNFNDFFIFLLQEY